MNHMHLHTHTHARTHARTHAHRGEKVTASPKKQQQQKLQQCLSGRQRSSRAVWL